MNEKTHTKLPEMVTYRCQSLPICLSREAGELMASLNSEEDHTRWEEKLWLLLAAPLNANALSMS